MKIDEPLIGKPGEVTELTREQFDDLFSTTGAAITTVGTEEDADCWEDEAWVKGPLKFNIPRQSDWEVKLWGNDSFVMRPTEGDEPNWWVRFWMKIFFNSKWSKV